MPTKIEWTSETWNPIIGCTKISDGCKNCYAEKYAWRLANNEATKNAYSIVNQNRKWTGHTVMIESVLQKPFHWKKTRMIFVCSMGDLFHESVDITWLAKVFAIIFLCPQHIFQILTKRPEKAEYYFKNDEFLFLLHKYCNQFHDEFIKTLEQELYFYDEIINEWPFKNIWLGVTAENQEQADKRIPILLQIPAKVRFISCEPLLSDIKILYYYGWIPSYNDPDNSELHPPAEPMILELNWVIAGPETGPKKRECKKEWIESLYKQCNAENVPFFDKKNVLGLNIQQYPRLD